MIQDDPSQSESSFHTTVQFDGLPGFSHFIKNILKIKVSY